MQPPQHCRLCSQAHYKETTCVYSQHTRHHIKQGTWRVIVPANRDCKEEDGKGLASTVFCKHVSNDCGCNSRVACLANPHQTSHHHEQPVFLIKRKNMRQTCYELIRTISETTINWHQQARMSQQEWSVTTERSHSTSVSCDCIGRQGSRKVEKTACRWWWRRFGGDQRSRCRCHSILECQPKHLQRIIT